MPQTALIAGYTGLVGRHLLARLLDDVRYERVKAVGRKAPALVHPHLDIIQSELGDLRRLGDQLACGDVYCCLGTTLKAAGSRAAFERVDYHMVVDLARATHAAGAKRFFVVSALSANPKSPIFYSRVKGRMEQSLKDVGFESVQIVRPSLLIGDRSEFRPGEALAQRVMPLMNPLMVGPLAQYRAVRGEEVADALIALSHRASRGVEVHTLPLKS